MNKAITNSALIAAAIAAIGFDFSTRSSAFLPVPLVIIGTAAKRRDDDDQKSDRCMSTESDSLDSSGSLFSMPIIKRMNSRRMAQLAAALPEANAAEGQRDVLARPTPHAASSSGIDSDSAPFMSSKIASQASQRLNQKFVEGSSAKLASASAIKLSQVQGNSAIESAIDTIVQRKNLTLWVRLPDTMRSHKQQNR